MTNGLTSYLSFLFYVGDNYIYFSVMFIGGIYGV